MSSNVNDVLNLVKQNSVKFIDFRFTDMFGSCYHKTYKADASKIGLMLANEIPIEGSFVTSRYVYENIILLPDLNTAFLDPFCAQATLVILCNIMDKDGKEHKCDSRSIAKRAHEHTLKSGIADQVHFSPEVEFDIFDDVKYHTGKRSSYFKLDFVGENSPDKKEYDETHELRYMMVPPGDQLHDIRSEILEMISEVGIKPLSHYLKCGLSKCGVKFEREEFLRSADNTQKFKYVIRNVASSYGKTVTFMPFPTKGCERSSMRCSQSLWKSNENLFFDQNNISETCLYYIGGIIKHGRAINAFTNPTTNSYASPLRLGYSYTDSARATIKIPYNDKTVQVCFSDAIANPYLCFAVQLMAGLDGIKNKIHPDEALDEYSEIEKNTVSQSLQDALDALNCDREFLLQGDVFTEEQINEYITVKRSEIKDKESAIHPVEFANYYNL